MVNEAMTATGETCSNSTPAVVDTLTIEFACDLSFASSGTRDVSASFADSSSHHGSSSTALSHTVNPPPPPEIFANGFEQP